MGARHRPSHQPGWDGRRAADEVEDTFRKLVGVSPGHFRGDLLFWAGSEWDRIPAGDQGEILYSQGKRKKPGWLDVGTSGQLLQTNGEDADPSWVDAPVGAITVVNRQGAKAAIANSTSRTTVYSFTVPADTLSTNKMIRMTLFAIYLNSSGSSRNYTLYVKYGGTEIYEDTSPAIGTDADKSAILATLYLMGDGATNAQTGGGYWSHQTGTGSIAVGLGQFGSDGPAMGIGWAEALAEDSTGDLTFDIAIAHSHADANISLTPKYFLAEAL